MKKLLPFFLLVSCSTLTPAQESFNRAVENGIDVTKIGEVRLFLMREEFLTQVVLHAFDEGASDVVCFK